MANELDKIAEDIRTQRRGIDAQLEDTSVRSAQTADLLMKIEELARRAADVQQRVPSSRTK